jgi:hypothetical protein
MLEPVEAEPVAAEPVAADVSPLDFLCSVYRDAGLPLGTRIRAATSAAQYCHPRISVLVPPGGNIAERLERLILEQRKRLIEHAPQPDQQHIRRRI